MGRGYQSYGKRVKEGELFLVSDVLKMGVGYNNYGSITGWDIRIYLG